MEVSDGELRVGQVTLATAEVARTEEGLRVVNEGEVGRQTSAGEVPTDHVLHGLRGKYETNVSSKFVPISTECRHEGRLHSFEMKCIG